MVAFEFISGILVIVSAVIILGCSVIASVDATESRFIIVPTDVLLGKRVILRARVSFKE